MKRTFFVFISSIIILFLAACSGSTATATQTVPTEQSGQVTPPQQTGEYPAPIDYSGVSAYPSSEVTSPVAVTPRPTYTTDPLMGSVIGRLLENSNGVENVTLYLAEVMQDKSGRDIVAGLDRINSPTADTDSQGKFAFINVKAGRYALILDVVISQYMINYPGENTPIIVDVITGEQFDLGDLNYDSLPLP
jgi:hypothetical protein